MLDYIEDLKDSLAIMRVKLDPHEFFVSWEEVEREPGFKPPWVIAVQPYKKAV